MQVNLNKYKKVFLGKSSGIGLSRRSGNSDRHVLINFFVEDDGTWHLFDEGQMSSYWMPEFVSLMNEAMKWIEDNCEKEDLVDGISYGWKFV